MHFLTFNLYGFTEYVLDVVEYDHIRQVAYVKMHADPFSIVSVPFSALVID